MRNKAGIVSPLIGEKELPGLFDSPGNIPSSAVVFSDPKKQLVLYTYSRLGRKAQNRTPRVKISPTGIFYLSKSVVNQLGIVDQSSKVLFCLDAESNQWYITLSNEGIPLYLNRAQNGGLCFCSSVLRANILESLSLQLEKIGSDDSFYMRVETEPTVFAAYGQTRFYHTEVIL